MLMMKYVLSTVLMVLIALVGGVARADDTHAMTKEQLLPLLGKSDVIIIDVSSNEGWEARDRKIPGALREEPMKFDSWKKKYPKDKTIVLYCS
jgi:rhodanese-related sulfurtransferase